MSKLQDMHMHQCYSPGLENFEEEKSAHSKGKKKAIMYFHKTYVHPTNIF
jgi:uncharacterized membrane protein YbaN (DUF454 family)